MVFESGAPQPSGAIAGNDNDADALRVEPHYLEIRRTDEVQIYESMMIDADCVPVGAEPRGLRRQRATPVPLAVRRDVVAIIGHRRERAVRCPLTGCNPLRVS
jgi:hypothetical protein